MRIHKKLKHLFKGFTLVELIVVISVLAVLASIAMSQVSNITAWARDSQRMTDMSAMKSSIELYKAKTGKLPIPTNGSGVTYSGALLWTQGTFGEPTWRQLNSITPKPVDPTNAIEYVYSVANNNREFELGGILEKATWYFPNILPQLLAASQNVTFIEGTYNGVSLKVETGSKTYVVAAPSLIGEYLGDAKLKNTGLTIEGLGSLPKGFSGVVVSTAQTGTFTPVIAWSGTTLPTTSTGAEALIVGLQNAYSGSNANSLSQISSLVLATGSQITALWEGLVENALGGDITGQSSGDGGGNLVVDVTPPASCPSGFISVPGNETFNQSGFCVMKYEAKVAGGSINSGYNGHNYSTGETIVSNATDVPIVNITQPQAIAACQSIWAHLITNNEWMTMARNIEQVSSNWSSGIVGNGYLYSGHSDNAPTNLLIASTNDNQGYLGTGDSAISPGDNDYTNFGSNIEQAYKWQRRTLTLSNWNVIWDLVGNSGEHVNKANTIDGTNYNSSSIWQSNACEGNNWYSFYGNDGFAQCAYINGYTYANNWPLTLNLNAANGIGRIRSSNTISNIFLRGGNWSHGAGAGMFALFLNWTVDNSAYTVGFRCAK